jgi:hypothetical protein
MSLKYCQGPECHTHKTKDRIKGPQENKTYQTRRRSKFYYGCGNFCSTWCQEQWFEKFGEQAINHFGRTTEPKHLTEENAWYKDYNYHTQGYNYVNGITEEQRPLTEEQYKDVNYTLNQ